MSSIYDVSFPQVNPDEPSYFLEAPADFIGRLAPVFAESSSRWSAGDFFDFFGNVGRFITELVAVI